MNESSKLPIPYHTCYSKPVINQVACNELLDSNQKFKKGEAHPHIEGLVYKGVGRNGTPSWFTPSKFKANRDRCRELNYQYYQENPDVKKASVHKWQKANKHKTNAIANKRRGRKLGADIDEFGVSHYTAYDKAITEQMHAHAGRLKECLGVAWEIDHVLPLNSGGSNRVNNLQLTPASWNHSKGDRNTNVFGAWEGVPDYSFFNK